MSYVTFLHYTLCFAHFSHFWTFQRPICTLHRFIHFYSHDSFISYDGTSGFLLALGISITSNDQGRTQRLLYLTGLNLLDRPIYLNWSWFFTRRSGGLRFSHTMTYYPNTFLLTLTCVISGYNVVKLTAWSRTTHVPHVKNPWPCEMYGIFFFVSPARVALTRIV